MRSDWLELVAHGNAWEGPFKRVRWWHRIALRLGELARFLDPVGRA